MLTVQNQTDQDWRDVEIWLNDHFRVTAPVIAARSRFDAPLRGFVTGFAQRFDPQRQSVRGIELTARAADGKPVKLVWGAGRRR